ncbi:MAG: hypothetical protein JSS79_08175 [Bacteroidetes bacterium]|nr:hypothetical protein [Bacteroidota bacterium]
MLLKYNWACNNMNVLVFSTSVQTEEQAKFLAPHIDLLAGPGNWNFALDDCDKILRIVSASVKPEAPICLLSELGFRCEELTDSVL